MCSYKTDFVSTGLVKKVYAFGGLCDKRYVADIQNKMLGYQSKANLR